LRKQVLKILLGSPFVKIEIMFDFLHQIQFVKKKHLLMCLSTETITS